MAHRVADRLHQTIETIDNLPYSSYLETVAYLMIIDRQKETPKDGSP